MIAMIFRLSTVAKSDQEAWRAHANIYATPKRLSRHVRELDTPRCYIIHRIEHAVCQAQARRGMLKT